MIEDLKPYPEYKDSGLPWLGKVPAHWQVRRIKTVLREIDRRSEVGREPLLSLRLHGGLVDHHALGGKTIPPSALIGYKHIKPGEIVMNRMRAALGLFAAAKSEGLVSPDYAIFHPVADVNLDYAVQLFRTPAMASVFRLESRGLGTGESGFLRLYSDRFGTIPIPLPPPDEQAAIVRFLGWATGQVDRAILAKRKVIALLNEQKQVIAYKALTQALSSAAGVKPSGIPWISSVPKHWEVLALKRVLSKLIDCEHKTAPRVENSEFRVVRTTAVRAGELRWGGTYCTSEAAYGAWTRRGLPEVGDVIFTREAPAGEACLVPSGFNLCLGQRTVLMKPAKEKLDSHFLLHSIYNGPPRIFIALFSQGSTVAHFNMSDIGSLPIFLPPKAEQEEIVRSISIESAKPSANIATLSREVQLLRELRDRLCLEAITGSVDVRSISVSLPRPCSDADATQPDDEADFGEDEVAA